MTISKITYKISYFIFIVASIFSVFVMIGSALSFLESTTSMDVPFVNVNNNDDQGYANLEIPFMNMHVGFQQGYIIIFMWLFFAFYALYFYALSQFFKIFTQTKVFTNKSLKKLRFFMKLNIFPILFAIVVSIVDIIRGVGFKMDSEYLLVIVHAIVILLIFFYLRLIKEGKLVQDENDLTI